MHKPHLKYKTLLAWTIVMGIVDLFAIVMIIVGALIMGKVINVTFVGYPFLIVGLVLLPWITPLFILSSISLSHHKKTTKVEKITVNK